MEEFLGNVLGAILAGLAAWVAALFVAKIIEGVIELVVVTAETIRNALRSRSEIAANRVSYVVVKKFLQEADCTVVSLDAFNFSGERVGKLKMSGKNVNVQAGSRIDMYS